MSIPSRFESAKLTLTAGPLLAVDNEWMRIRATAWLQTVTSSTYRCVNALAIFVSCTVTVEHWVTQIWNSEETWTKPWRDSFQQLHYCCKFHRKGELKSKPSLWKKCVLEHFHCSTLVNSLGKALSSSFSKKSRLLIDDVRHTSIPVLWMGSPETQDSEWRTCRPYCVTALQTRTMHVYACKTVVSAETVKSAAPDLPNLPKPHDKSVQEFLCSQKMHAMPNTQRGGKCHYNNAVSVTLENQKPTEMKILHSATVWAWHTMLSIENIFTFRQTVTIESTERYHEILARLGETPNQSRLLHSSILVRFKWVPQTRLLLSLCTRRHGRTDLPSKTRA